MVRNPLKRRAVEVGLEPGESEKRHREGFEKRPPIAGPEARSARRLET